MLAATTLASVPVLIVSYAISNALEAVLPDKPTLPLIFGGLTANTFHCIFHSMGKGSEATLHEYLKHGLFRFSRSLRP